MSNSKPLTLPKVEESRIVFNNFAKIRQDRLSRPGVVPYEYFTLITKATAVVVMAKDDQDRWIMLREYRHSVGKVLLCFPAGFIDDGEKPVEAAKRELLEETGHIADHFEVIGSAYPFPGISTQETFYVMASNARKVAEPHLEPSEVLETQVMSEQQLVEAVLAGEPLDGALLTGIAFYQMQKA